MKILAATDFHGDVGAFQKVSLKARRSHVNMIVVCGDVTHFGSVQQAKELLSSLLATKSSVLFVPGNCDPPALAEEKIETIESIHGKCRQIGNINFFGVGGSSPSPFDTPFELTETEIANILERGYNACQAKRRTILISHSPPKDTKVDVTSAGEHAGSFSVREFIEKTNPDLVLCGHIHEATGIDRMNDTIIVNPGPARHGKCALIDLNESINVRLESL